MLGKNTNKEEVIATFSHLQNVQIGKNNFTNEDLEKYFGAMGKITGSNKPATILLKQVFQKEYPITRIPNDKSLPRVPSKIEEKLKLIECITRYFNHLRSRIIFKKYKTGDSASLREMLSELQSIKVLKEHFEETKETFPYHMFADYLTNADFINLKGDIASQMRGLESKKVQDERIRNLLRQFTVTYLKNRNSKRFVLKDPGVSEREYNDEEDEIGILPSILEDLLAFINDKQAIFKNNKSYDLDISPYLQQMKDSINKLKAKSDSVSLPSGGGSDSINELEEINKSYNELFDSMYSKYIELLAKYNDSKTPEECQKDLKVIQEKLDNEKAKVAKSEEKINTKKNIISRLKTKIKQLEGFNKEKNELNSQLSTELTQLRSELVTNQANLLTSENILKEHLAVKESTQEVLRLTEEVAKITAALDKAKQEQSEQSVVSKLEEERLTIQAALDLALIKLSNQQEDTYRDIRANIQSQLERYTQTIEQKNRDIEAARARATEAEVLVARLNRNVESKEELIVILNVASEAYIKATARAASQASTAEKNLAEAQDETRLASEKLATLQKSLDELTTQTTEEIRNLTDAKAAVIRELDAANEAAKVALATAANDAAEQRRLNLEDIARVERENAQREQSINQKNKGELDELTKQIRTETELRRAQDEAIKVIRKNYTDELNNVNEMIKAQNAAFAELETTSSDHIDGLIQRIKELEGSGEQAKEELQAAQAELTATKATIRDINSKYDTLQLTYNDFNNKLQVCQTSKTQETTQLQERIKMLERDVGRKESELNDAVQKEKTSAESQIRAVREEVALARKKLSEAEIAARTLKEQSDKIRKDNQELVTQRDKANESKELETRSAKEAAEREAKAIADVAQAKAEIARITALEIAARRKEEEAEAAKRVALASVSLAEGRASVAEWKASEAEGRASEAEERASEAEGRAFQASTERNTAVLSQRTALTKQGEAEVALSRAIEAQQTAVEARSAAELARDNAIRRAENAERNAQKALEEAQASKIRQENLLQTTSRIVGLEQQVATLTLDINELNETIVGANDEIKAQQQQIRELKKNKRTFFGKLQEGVDSYFGEGGKNDMLLDYCNKVANDSLNTFLLEEPLPFFSLIKDFEKGSKIDVFKTTNEEYILKLFIKHHLEEHFNSKDMKEFYFHAKEIFAKQDYSEYAKMFFVLNEIINVIRSSKDDIDIVRIKSKEYNSSFDYLEYILQDYEYDFYTIAKKKFLLDDTHDKEFNLTFVKENIYISVNKGSKTYDLNKNLTLSRKDFDFKSDIYYISSSMIYLFFILSTHFYLQSENMIDTNEYFTVSNNLEKTVRKLKRTKNKEKKSIAKLFKERKEFKLDG
jgi:hypothetical protein